jgi:hypothetical protein
VNSTDEPDSVPFNANVPPSPVPENAPDDRSIVEILNVPL